MPCEFILLAIPFAFKFLAFFYKQILYHSRYFYLLIIFSIPVVVSTFE